MKSKLASVSDVSGNKIPDELYIGFIDSLLIDVRGLVLAGSAMILAGAISAIASRSVSLWACTAVIGLVLLLRLFFMVSHARDLPSVTIQDARRRETSFLVGAVLFMLALSVWT